MAGVSTKDIKQRIRSMESTRQITRAMEMVAASKLRKAQERVLNSRPYFEQLYATIAHIACTKADITSPYLVKRDCQKTCCIVIAGDRGLAGGYNSNVFKLVSRELEGGDYCVVPIGKRAVEYFRARGTEILTQQYNEAADISIGDCFTLSKQITKGFLAGKFDRVCIAFTNFVSVLTQTPSILPVLPLSLAVTRSDPGVQTLYEPDAQTVFDAIIPEYVGGVVYGALCESVASELAARRTAMDSATKNANEMIAELNLKYNRARQGAITQEITEIVAGAEA